MASRRFRPAPILAGFAAKGVDPHATLAEQRAAEGEQAIALAERHRLHIDRWFYACDRAMHARLADLYVGDERFAASFDRHGEGVAVYVATAIRANAARANAG